MKKTITMKTIILSIGLTLVAMSCVAAEANKPNILLIMAFATGEWELYNLKKDRTETNNLASSHPEKLAELTAKYDAWWREMEPKVFYPAKK